MKKIGKILLVIACFFTLSLVVKADEIGGGGAGRGGGAGTVSCKGNNVQCNNNKIGPYFKVTLYYIQQGSPWEQIGDSYFIAGSDAYADALSAYNVSRDHIIVISTVGTDATSKTRFKDGSKAIRCYYDLATTSGNACSDAEDGIYRGSDNSDMNKLPNANLVDLLRKFTGRQDYASVLTKESVVINRENAATYGYRIIIEPVFLFFNNKKPSFAATPRQLAFEKQGNSSYSIQGQSYPVTRDFPNSSTKPTMLQALFTDYNDVGIANPGGESHKWSDIESTCSNMSYKNVSNTNGCGMNILDVGKYIKPKKCYKRVQNGNIECKNIDSINSGTFTERYQEVQCDGLNDSEKTNSQYGKQIAKSGKCILYGTERGDVYLPGGISTSNTTYAVNSKHTYFAWPSTNENTGMPAIIRNTVAFKLVNTGGSGACSEAEINDLTAAAKNAMEKSTFELKLTGGDFQPINGELLTAKKDPLIGNVNISTSSFTGNVSSEFSLSKRAYMIIPENRNRIFNTITGNVSDGTVANELLGERDRKQGVVSLAVDSTLGKKWELKLSGLRFGVNGDIKPEVDHYVCEITTHEPCFCPSKYVQKNLDEMVAEGRTCTQAQTAAIEAGECDEFCESKYNGSKVKITDCVIDEMYKNGNDLNKAIEACIDKTDECKLKKYCQTSAGVEIPEKQYEDCIDSISGKTRAEKELICDDKLCGCVVNGKTPQEYINCIDNGGSRSYCTFAHCDKQNVCKQCLYCTTNCHWYDENDLQSNQTVLVKKCDNGDPKDIDCGHHLITNKSCVLNVLNVSNLKDALETNKITVRDLLDAIEKCNFDNTNISVSRDNLVMRPISLDDPFYSTSEKSYEKALGKYYSNTGNPSRYPSEPFSDPKVVEKTILKARGVKGDDLYKLAPELEITTNPEQMKNIKDYNKRNPLSDFNLECAEGNNYCHSKFLDDENLVTITKDTQKSKCGGIDTSTKAGFKKCYESNN